MFVMLHRDCVMETNGFENGGYSKFMRQYSYNYGKFDRKYDRKEEEEEEEEEFGDQLSPKREKSQNYIEHTVSKMDTLAGIAIKYGVEVADIKKMNNLVTDLQMFALKTLQIPPARHPPSPSLANGLDTRGPSSSKKPPLRHRHSDLFETFHSLKPKSSAPSISPAINSLQRYYGTSKANHKNTPEGFEMAVYHQNGGSNYSGNDQFADVSSRFSNLPLSLQRKSKSVANNLSSKNGHLSSRRRQKSEIDFNSPTPAFLMEDNNNISNSIGFSKITGKGLALRPSRTSSGGDSDGEKLNSIPINMPDNIVTESLISVKKSSSTSSLHDQENYSSGSSSIWDLQALSAAVITRPIFDGFPKTITGRKNKAALD